MKLREKYSLVEVLQYATDMSLNRESSTLLPPEKIEKLYGKKLVWGQISKILFTVLVNNNVALHLSDKGTQYFDADIVALVDPNSLVKAPSGSKGNLSELVQALQVLSALEAYDSDAFDTSLLEPEAIRALQGKWFFHNELLDTGTDLIIFGKVINLCKAIEAQLGIPCLVTAGSTQYANAQVLAYVSPRFLRLDLLHETAIETIREKLLHLVGKDQVRKNELQDFSSKKEHFWQKADETLQALSQESELKVRRKAHQDFVVIWQSIDQIQDSELKLIHLGTQIIKYTHDLDQFRDPHKVASTYVLLALLSECAEELLS